MAGIGTTIATVKGRAVQAWAGAKRRFPWLAHAVEAYQHFNTRNGNYLAAAIAYFSFLALFPLILLGVSIAGFVLSNDQHLLNSLLNSVSRNASGSFGTTLKEVINTAVKNRAGVGIIGVVGVALTGLGWIDNLRTAIDVVWGIAAKKRSFIAKKLADALVLAGLGLGVVISLALTAGGTAATGSVLKALDLSDVTGVSVLARVLGIALAIVGDMLVFGWLILRLPDVSVPRWVGVRATLLAAVGFEILKVIGTIYIARVAKSPTAGIFGSVVGVLVWIDLVSRFVLYCVAWTATGVATERTETASEPGEAAVPPSAVALQRPRPSPLGLAAGLFGAGAAVGAAAFAALQKKETEPPR